MTTNYVYTRCAVTAIPTGVRFDVPRASQGQIVEVAFGGFDRCEHDDGAPYMRRHDRSMGSAGVEYYRLAK